MNYKFVINHLRTGTRCSWKSAYERRKYLDELTKRTEDFGDSLTSPYDRLYKLTFLHLTRNHGSGLLKLYGSSIAMCVCTEYPEFAFKLWKFEKPPDGWWIHLATLFNNSSCDPIAEAVLREFVLDAMQEKNLKTLDEWENVSHAHLGSSLLQRFNYLGGLHYTLQRLFPNHKWNKQITNRVGKFE